MNIKNLKNILKGGLFAFLFMSAVIDLMADTARVVSKQENLPYGRNSLRTRVFLDTTPNDENNRADAYVDINYTDKIMSLQEFSDMIRVGDVIEYRPGATARDGRYLMIDFTDLIELNKRNLYEIFTEEFEDGIEAPSIARQAYEARQAASQKNSGR